MAKPAASAPNAHHVVSVANVVKAAVNVASAATIAHLRLQRRYAPSPWKPPAPRPQSRQIRLRCKHRLRENVANVVAVTVMAVSVVNVKPMAVKSPPSP